MTRQEYQSARLTLGWTHQCLGNVIGVSRRSCCRYGIGEAIPEPTARLIRLLVYLRLTASAAKFNEIVKELRS
jgi:hypothetical protein